MIIANSAVIIQKGGIVLKYTHVISYRSDDEYFYINGETDDSIGFSRKNVFDKFQHENIIQILIMPRKPV